MARERTRDRLYLKNGRFYADLRDYADVGGRLQAMIPSGQTLATTDRDAAQRVLTAALERLECLRRGRVVGGIAATTTLRVAAVEALQAWAARKTAEEPWLAQCERHLRAACAFFGDDRDPATIRLADVEAWDVHLRTVPLELPKVGAGRRCRVTRAPLGDGTRRQYLNTLGKLFKRLGHHGMVPYGHNPVSAMEAKPQWRPREGDFLEVPEAALYIHAAGLVTPTRPFALRYGKALIATYLYTGMRESEAYMLDVADVDLQRNLLHVRWRRGEDQDDAAAGRLKTRGAVRTLPIFPELRVILTEYLTGPHRPTGRLLFPSPHGPNTMLTDTRKVLEEAAAVAYRIAPPELRDAFRDPKRFRTLLFRHTFCSARLQCVDNERPISRETVEYEMGHGSRAMIDKVYKHLGRFRYRGEHVTYPLASAVAEMEQVKAA